MEYLSLKPRTDLLTRELDGEVVIYDTQSDHCHVLNPAAAIVWKHCGDELSIDELASVIANKTNLPADPAVVHLALGELFNAKLFEGDTGLSTLSTQVDTVDRRKALLHMGVIAASLPVVTSLLAPSPAMALSAPRPEPEP